MSKEKKNVAHKTKRSVIRTLLDLFSSLLFWFLTVVFLFAAASAYRYYYFDDLSWKEFYDFASLMLRGFLLSSIFYFLVVYLPAHRKRRVVKANFRKSYRRIKREIVSDIIQYSIQGGRTDLQWSEELVKKLLTTEGFREVFAEGRESDEGFYAFCNHIQSSKQDFRSLVFKFKILEKQLSYILHNYEIHDENQFDFMKRLEVNLFRLENIDNEYDDIKSFSNFIWQVFAGFSFIDGYIGYDFIEEAIEAI